MKNFIILVALKLQQLASDLAESESLVRVLVRQNNEKFAKSDEKSKTQFDGRAVQSNMTSALQSQ